MNTAPAEPLRAADDLRLILATDLDGTFLGGTMDQRRGLYDYLRQWRDRVLLVYVTGRDLGFIQQLKDEGLVPHPDFVIGDVGTTVVRGPDFGALAEVQDPIAALWDDAGDRVRAMLEGEPGIKPQPTRFERRMSYYYEPDRLRPQTVEKIRAAGFDVILSADLYLDVMPRGVAKGPTLRRFIDTLDLPARHVLVAGDTMNDLSLFETGLDGVAVGNSEPRLVAELPRLTRTYHSPQPGCAGILDAIRHFGKDLED